MFGFHFQYFQVPVQMKSKDKSDTAENRVDFLLNLEIIEWINMNGVETKVGLLFMFS